MGITSFHLPSIPVGVKAYCGHFTDEELEAELLSILSSVSQNIREGFATHSTQHSAFQMLQGEVDRLPQGVLKAL